AHSFDPRQHRRGRRDRRRCRCNRRHCRGRTRRQSGAGHLHRDARAGQRSRAGGGSRGPDGRTDRPPLHRSARRLRDHAAHVRCCPPVRASRSHRRRAGRARQPRRDAERGALGTGPAGPARAAAQRHLRLHRHRIRRHRLRDRHRHPAGPQRLRRPRGDRIRRNRWRHRRRLQRPRHPRRRNRRGLHLRRGQGSLPGRRPGAGLRGLRHERGRHRRHRLGDGAPPARAAGGGEHEPRRRGQHGGRQRRVAVDLRRRHLRGGRRQRQRRRNSAERLLLLPGAGDRGAHRGGQRPLRPSRVVQQLRLLRGPVRARRGHHQRLVHRGDRDQHHQRHVDGDAARGRRGRALPPGQPCSEPGDGLLGDQDGDHQGPHRHLPHGEQRPAVQHLL
ncbi:MAG: Alkaline serine exoprotease A precursor, partial [uncultured Blastococcus sp.]